VEKGVLIHNLIVLVKKLEKQVVDHCRTTLGQKSKKLNPNELELENQVSKIAQTQ
jgi:hypothetical protein